MSVATEHYSEWIASKVDPEIINLNVVSLEKDGAYESLLYALNGTARRNDGRLRDKWLNRYDHLEDGGWWCSGINPLTFEDTDWGCFKPNTPKNIDGTIIKYEHPPQTQTEIFCLKTSDKIWLEIADRFPAIRGSTIYDEPKTDFWKLLIETPQMPLLFTEGAKKAGVLLTAGYPAIALSGIDSGYRNTGGEKVLIPQLDVFAQEGREIVFVFDQDKRFKTRTRVRDSIKAYTKLLKGKKCKVSVISWDSEQGKGVDDFIASQGVEAFHQNWKERLTYDDWLIATSRQATKLTFDQLFDFVSSEIADELAFNDLKSEILFRGERFTFGEEIRAWFFDEFGYIASKEDIQEVLLYFAKKNTYNPIAKYLDKVYREADRVSLDNLASRYFGTTDPLYNQMVKKWLISAVARGTSPGAKVDHVLVLFGSQGLYKSGFFSVLGNEFYDSSATNKLSDKDTKLIIHSCWIEEFAEYERLNKKEQGEVKHWFTLERDNFRKPYGRVTEDHKRRCVFGASCNKHEFLVDETGDRRMWVIPINESALPKGKLDLDTLAKERDGAWAAAVDAYLSGEKWWTDREEEKLVSQSNERFRSYDEWTEIIQAWIERKGYREVVISEILKDALLIDPAQQDRKIQMRVADILTRLGWVKVIRGKTRARVWVAPEIEVDHPENDYSERVSPNTTQGVIDPPQRSIAEVDHPQNPLVEPTLLRGDRPDQPKPRNLHLGQKIVFSGKLLRGNPYVDDRGELKPLTVMAINGNTVSVKAIGWEFCHELSLDEVKPWQEKSPR